MATLFLLLDVFVIYPCSSTSLPSTPASQSCENVYIQYTLTKNKEIPPKRTNPAHQPYRFESYARIVNYGENELKSWRFWVGFQNDEYLVSATNAIFEDGTPLPASTTSAVKAFTGFPMPDLKSAIQTAGDLEQMRVTIDFVGTEFRVQKPNTPMLRTVYLLNDGYKCSQPSKRGNFLFRNGTLLPSSMDPSRSKSVFQLQVRKVPPYLNRTLVIPPQAFEISGKFSPGYKCGPVAYVTPSTLLDSSLLPTNQTAVASWQVVCNIAPPEEAIPKCCVSFSAFYNESVIPCQTCGRGCDRYPTRTCNATAPANLFPLDALPILFANRTNKAIAWASTKHLHYTQPEPCPDFCRVSIHWHVKSNDAKGRRARITLFNWGEINFADWFAAMQFRKAVPGFEAMYCFNGTALNGSLNTIFMQGLEGANYIDGEVDGAKPDRDPRVPGRLESVISFTKEKTPGIDIVAGDKFPTKVFFNGGECTLPAELP